MPVLVLTASPLADPAEERAALQDVAHAVAGALGLVDSDVIITYSHAAEAAAPTWPVLICHGHPRDPEAMTAALSAAREVIAGAWNTTSDQVWTQWCLNDDAPVPPRPLS